MRAKYLFLLGFIMRTSGSRVFVGHSRLCVLVSPRTLQYTLLHLSLASYFYNSTLLSLYALDLLKNRFGLFYNYLIYNTMPVTVYSPLFSTQHCTSLVNIFPNLSWYEREVSEFFGIVFLGSRDTRCLFLQYGTYAHPLCKFWGESTSRGIQTGYVGGVITY